MQPTERPVVDQPVLIPAGRVTLEGLLTVPPGASGIVAFAHGTGSGRLSPRNQHVARALQARGLATLLLDLLTAVEEADLSSMRFDVDMLGRRLQVVADWLAGTAETASLPLGLFGASTGAAAALHTAAARPDTIGAVVSRGGRPDLAGLALTAVRAPTLLIVGGRDATVLDLNRSAKSHLAGPSELQVVPGAGHLFEEPGTLDEVARLAGDWFARYLPAFTPTGSPG
jgi:putative phosphoribosyl transferase